MQNKSIVIVGYGPGTATAVAERFGKEGFAVALVGRNEERLAEGVVGSENEQCHGIRLSG